MHCLDDLRLSPNQCSTKCIKVSKENLYHDAEEQEPYLRITMRKGGEMDTLFILRHIPL